MSQTYTLLSETQYGVPSGNYDGSSADWASNGVRAADYYHGHGGLQTVRYQLQSFVGEMRFEATLDPTATDANWFTVLTVGNGIVPVTELRSQSIVGNFTWMRVQVLGFESGAIDFVNIAY